MVVPMASLASIPADGIVGGWLRFDGIDDAALNSSDGIIKGKSTAPWTLMEKPVAHLILIPAAGKVGGSLGFDGGHLTHWMASTKTRLTAFWTRIVMPMEFRIIWGQVQGRIAD